MRQDTARISRELKFDRSGHYLAVDEHVKLAIRYFRFTKFVSGGQIMAKMAQCEPGYRKQLFKIVKFFKYVQKHLTHPKLLV